MLCSIVVALTFRLYLVVPLVARTPFLILLVARWLRTVWFGMISTLASSLWGVVPLRMLLLRNMGSEGGWGSALINFDALAKAGSLGIL